MQELISALTAHEEECSREFEADLSAFCTRHMDAQLVQQLRQLVAEGEEEGYKEDKKMVTDAIQGMKDGGLYPKKLWEE